MTTLPRHWTFYYNKYLVTPFARNTYFLSYDFDHKALWYRVPKVASRTIDYHLRSECTDGGYVYSSEVGYRPSMFDNYFKFAFVRNPESRMISAWKDKVLRFNYFGFREKEWKKMHDFGNFIKWVKKLDIRKCDEHLRAQSAMIDLNHVDFIGRFEQFEQDFEAVTDHIGLENAEPVQLNAAPSQEQEALVTEALRFEIMKIYRKDYQLFYPEELANADQPDEIIDFSGLRI